MNLQSIKTASEVSLSGIAVELEKRDGSIFSIKFTDESGNTVTVAKNNYSEIYILVPAKPVFTTKHAVIGKLLGLTEYSEIFDNEFEAQQRLTEIEKANGYREGLGLSVQPTEVAEVA